MGVSEVCPLWRRELVAVVQGVVEEAGAVVPGVAGVMGGFAGDFGWTIMLEY